MFRTKVLQCLIMRFIYYSLTIASHRCPLPPPPLPLGSSCLVPPLMDSLSRLLLECPSVKVCGSAPYRDAAGCCNPSAFRQLLSAVLIGLSLFYARLIALLVWAVPRDRGPFLLAAKFIYSMSVGIYMYIYTYKYIHTYYTCRLFLPAGGASGGTALLVLIEAHL